MARPPLLSQGLSPAGHIAVISRLKKVTSPFSCSEIPPPSFRVHEETSMVGLPTPGFFCAIGFPAMIWILGTHIECPLPLPDFFPNSETGEHSSPGFSSFFMVSPHRNFLFSSFRSFQVLVRRSSRLPADLRTLPKLTLPAARTSCSPRKLN